MTLSDGEILDMLNEIIETLCERDEELQQRAEDLRSNFLKFIQKEQKDES